MGFPETPRGSPEAIEGAGELLSQAADVLEEGESALSQTARGLSGVAWSSPAEGRFTAGAGALSGVCDGAQEALRTCARATRRYAEALDVARRIIEREREEYEEAQIAQASAGQLIGSLSMRRGMVEPESKPDFDRAISDAEDELAAAGGAAAGRRGRQDRRVPRPRRGDSVAPRPGASLGG